MYTKHVSDGTQESLWDVRSVDQAQGRKWIWTGSPDLRLCVREQDVSADSDNRRDSGDHSQGLAQFVADVPPGLALPRGKTITISVIGGPSKGLARRLVKPHVSIGRSGCGADIQVDDQEVSDMHCAVAVKGDIIRLCDLDSYNGTYVERQRVSAAPLEHFSEFRIGSSVLLLTVRVAHAVATVSSRDQFETGEE